MFEKENASAINKTVTVIIPIYNTEPYLCRCLDSVVLQTYKNMEIILVDDCSTDNSFEICKEYVKKDKRIKIVQNSKNMGLGFSRNVGLLHSTGNYITFLDSDDYLKIDAIEMLVKHINTKEYDLVISKMVKVTQDGKESNYKNDYLDNYESSGVEALKNIFLEKNDCSACAKLYTRKIIGETRFLCNTTNEDFPFVSNVLLKAAKVMFITNVTYCYFTRDNSITTSAFSDKQFDKINNSYSVYSLIKKNNKRMKKFAKQYYIKQSFYLYKRLLMDYSIRSKFHYYFVYVRRILKRNTLSVVFFNTLKAKEKASIIYATFFPKKYIKKHH